MRDVAAIVLAAGLSRRMGTGNKLLLPITGVPMVRHVVDQYCAAIDGAVLVVLGHQSHVFEAALQGSGARTVINPAYARLRRGHRYARRCTRVPFGNRKGVGMTRFRRGLAGIMQKLTLAQDQAKLLAKVKFPCC